MEQDKTQSAKEILEHLSRADSTQTPPSPTEAEQEATREERLEQLRRSLGV